MNIRGVGGFDAKLWRHLLDAERQFTPSANKIAHAVTVANNAEENSLRITMANNRFLVEFDEDF